jgi:hypothetical protein
LGAQEGGRGEGEEQEAYEAIVSPFQFLIWTAEFIETSYEQCTPSYNNSNMADIKSFTTLLNLGPDTCGNSANFIEVLPPQTGMTYPSNLLCTTSIKITDTLCYDYIIVELMLFRSMLCYWRAGVTGDQPRPLSTDNSEALLSYSFWGHVVRMFQFMEITWCFNQLLPPHDGLLGWHTENQFRIFVATVASSCDVQGLAHVDSHHSGLRAIEHRRINWCQAGNNYI